MRVRVAEDADPLLARRVEIVEWHLFDLEVLLERCRQGLLLGGVAEVGEEAVVAEDGEAGVLERDERHQRVAVLALAADLVGVGACGLVAVVAVGDEELGRSSSSAWTASITAGSAMRQTRLTVPSASVASPHGAPCGGGGEVGPGVALVEGEDGGEVVARRLGQAQAVLLRAGLGALVRPDEAGAVVGDPDAAEEAAAGVPRAVRSLVLLLERPERLLAVGGEDALERPVLERLGGVLVAGRRRRARRAGRSRRR